MNTMIANTVLAQDSTKSLFRANTAREARKKKAKEDGGGGIDPHMGVF
jgi:hypothetical protein